MSAPQNANDLTAQILIALSKNDTRLWRFGAGMAWQGRIVERTSKRLVLQPYYAVKLAPEGFPDTAGFSGPGCIFTGIEIKFGRDRIRPAQASFIDMVLSLGGRAGIARSVAEAEQIIRMEVRR